MDFCCECQNCLTLAESTNVISCTRWLSTSRGKCRHHLVAKYPRAPPHATTRDEQLERRRSLEMGNKFLWKSLLLSHQTTWTPPIFHRCHQMPCMSRAMRHLEKIHLRHATDCPRAMLVQMMVSRQWALALGTDARYDQALPFLLLTTCRRSCFRIAESKEHSVRVGVSIFVVACCSR